MNESIEKYSASLMFQSSSSSPPTTFDNNDYTISGGESSPSNGSTKSMTIVDGRFFKMIPERCIMNTTVATCVKCEPRYIEIKGSVNSSSNFLCHLKRKHGTEAVQEYTEYLHSKRRCRRQPPPVIIEPARQIKIKVIGLQEQLERNILKFIVNSMLPIETVTNGYFLDIFKSFNIPEHDLRIFNREHLSARLGDLFNKILEQLKMELKEASQVCFVANVWQIQENSCLVTTAHWIDAHMKRRSAVLRTQKLSPDEYQYHIVDHDIKQIKEEFHIRNSRIYTTMPEVCSLFKAFSAYGIDKNSIADQSQETDDKIILKNDILSVLEPRYLSCYVQILSNFASFDVIKTISNCRMLSNIHGRIMKKCNILWSHPEAADVLEEIIGLKLSKPSMNSWTSLYTAFVEILTIKDKSIDIFQALEIKDHLNESDFVYINEHLTCTKPLADALAILEDPQHSLFGSLLPTLLALRRQLNKLIKREWIYCVPIVIAIANMVNEKFQSSYKFETSESVAAAIAAFSHPEFKNRWLSCVDAKFQTNMLQAFKAAVEGELPKIRTSDLDGNVSNLPSRSDFFDFDSENEINEPIPSKAVADMQVLNFFNYTSRSLESLKHFPEIYKVFMKYNTPLSSFSTMKQMIEHDILKDVLMSDKKDTDTDFEMKIWLKANKNFL